MTAEKNIVITGSSGYIGKKLTSHFLSRGYKVTGLKRSLLYGDIEELYSHLRDVHAVVHLSGASILRRWTRSAKAEIYNSRVFTTRHLVMAIQRLPETARPRCFISASAIGIYENNRTHSEGSSDFSSGFLGKTVQDWEEASANMPPGVRRVIARTGLVLGSDAMMMKRMAIPFRLGLGGKIGNGRQPFPFIHINDLLDFYIESVENENFKGIYNLTAPGRVTNEIFMKTFAGLLRRPCILVLPGWLLKTLLGEASAILLNSPEVIPERLMKQNFHFNYPEVLGALKEVVSSLKKMKLPGI